MASRGCNDTPRVVAAIRSEGSGIAPWLSQEPKWHQSLTRTVRRSVCSTSLEPQAIPHKELLSRPTLPGARQGVGLGFVPQ